MGKLDNFKMVKYSNAEPFLTLTDRMLTFSKQAIDLLDSASFVHAFFDQENALFAVQACEKDSNAFPFVKHEKMAPGKQVLVRWGSKEILVPLKNLLNKKIPPQGLRIYGEYDEDENLIIFDINNNIPVEKRNK